MLAVGLGSMALNKIPNFFIPHLIFNFKDKENISDTVFLFQTNMNFPSENKVQT